MLRLKHEWCYHKVMPTDLLGLLAMMISTQALTVPAAHVALEGRYFHLFVPFSRRDNVGRLHLFYKKFSMIS
jgi:hypothetical protein